MCNTSSRPRARWTFPQGEGDSELLTLPAWQRVSRATVWRESGGWGGGVPSLTLLSVWSRRPSASVGATRRQFAPGKHDTVFNHQESFEALSCNLAANKRGATKKKRSSLWCDGRPAADWLINPLQIQHHSFSHAVCDGDGLCGRGETHCLRQRGMKRGGARSEINSCCKWQLTLQKEV